MATRRQLPVEILTHIFSLLDSESRKSAANTCREWCNVYRNDVRFASYLKIVVELPGCIALNIPCQCDKEHNDRFLETVTRSGLVRFDFVELNKVIASFPKLKRLRLVFNEYEYDPIVNLKDFPMRLNDAPLLEKVTLVTRGIIPPRGKLYPLLNPSSKLPKWLQFGEFTFCPKCKHGPLTFQDISAVFVNFLNLGRLKAYSTDLLKYTRQMRRLELVAFETYVYVSVSMTEIIPMYKAIDAYCKDLLNQIKDANPGPNCPHQTLKSKGIKSKDLKLAVIAF